jgi:copper homeostasis protein
VSIPVNVMTRPHFDSFVYSSADIEVMAADIRVCKQLNASGIVLGVLDGQKSIDIPAMKRLRWVGCDFP